MADDSFRPHRGRDPLARDAADLVGNDANDPLAELARLIGQKDPYADPTRREPHPLDRASEDAEAPDAEWVAEENYAEQDDRREDDRYAPPPPPSPASFDAYEPQEQSYEDEPTPAGGRYFSGPAAQFSGFREPADAGYPYEQQPASRPRDLPAYATAAPEDDYEAAEEPHESEEAYADDDYHDRGTRSRRRGSMVFVVAVLGLAVIGTAGAFAYHAMFGGSVLPSLPPIIKASNGPNKIVPSYGESQASNTNPTSAANGGSTEHLVSREEQPVNMEPPKVIPHVVATIPIVSGPGSAPAGAAGSAASPAPPAPAAETAASTPWPPAPPAPGAAAQAPAVPAPASTPAAGGATTAPKRIHTVIIRTDQQGAEAAPAQAAPPTPPLPPPAPAVRTPARAASPPPAPRASAAASPPAGANAPLSIVPNAERQAAAPMPARTHTTAAPMSVASTVPVAGTATAPSSGHGYDVQVTSQRSEAEAQAEFRTLRARYPEQLGGREPIIRRADLGAKGTYYRAMVGPFASMEEAAGLCSRLKAAGGSCLVQRN